MKVKELIELLKKEDPEAEVRKSYFYSNGDSTGMDVDEAIYRVTPFVNSRYDQKLKKKVDIKEVHIE